MKNLRIRYKVPTREELNSIAKKWAEKGMNPSDYEGWMRFYIRCREDDITKSNDILRAEKERIKRAIFCIQTARGLLQEVLQERRK